MMQAKTLCLNMIVKNEMANLERCLSSVVDHIACWVICDTGSTDGTQDFIRAFFAARNIPGELHSFPFHNFEQARNAALDCAQASPIPYDYILLDDADMELVVEDRDFRTKLTAPSYSLLQRSGITYWNPRLVHRSAGARYHGVTHEYLDVPGGGERLHGVWYKDHASGSNRVDKFERDIRLLTEALEKEPENGRYWFYLGQSHRDAEQTAKAVEIYAKRAEMGGWDEEAWYARLQQARCLRKLGDEGGFLRQALAAFEQRPQRAEPLYDLARYFREKGKNETSVLFSEAALAMQKPEQDTLFLEEFVYAAGVKEEYSISANYSRDPARKDRGFAACNWLALNRTIPEASRHLAISNLHFYIEPAGKIMPSFTARPIEFTAPDGYRPTNPSITRYGGQLVVVQRTVNYTIDRAIPDGDDRRYATPDGEPIRTRNFLLRLNDDLLIQSSAEIMPPENMPDPAWPRVQGFEDLRPFAWGDQLWCIACVRELTPEGWCEQALARIDESAPGQPRLADWRVLHPEGPRSHEKNWMPLVDGDALRFIYQCDPTRVLDHEALTIAKTVPAIKADQFRGGSQLISFDGGRLALIHEARVRDGQRHYRHRFVWFDEDARLRRVSRPFYFQKRGVEFAAGIAFHADGRRLVITYGVEDSEAWIATVEVDDVRRMLEDAETLSFGVFSAHNSVAAWSATAQTSTERQSSNLKGDGEFPVHFIVGVPRSGTTLFRAMLGAHPAICAPSETPWVTGAYGERKQSSLRGLLHNILDAGDGPVKNIKGVSKADVSRAAQVFVCTLFASKMKREGKKLLLLKTPDDIWFVDELIEFFPDAKILHLRRDVRDVALSTVNAGFPTLNNFGENNFANAVERWIACETKVEQIAKRHANVHSFRFEDLVENPKGELQRAAQILGVPFDPRMLDFASYLTDAPAWEAGSRDVLRQSSLKSARAWVHRSTAPTAEQRTVIEDNADRISALGYSSDWQLESNRSQVVIDKNASVNLSQDVGMDSAKEVSSISQFTKKIFLSLAPFLRSADSASERREQCRAFDARIAPFLSRADGASLPQIHCFYEVLSGNGMHDALVAATTSMRAAGHPVRVWSYSPQKLEFLPRDVEVCRADDVVPLDLFKRIVAGSTIRYFSDVFRYAVLYEHGGLWMDSDVVMLRPFPFRGEYFFNLQWRSDSKNEHFICGNVMYAEPFSRHMRSLFESSIDRFFAGGVRLFGEVGPKLLSDYVASEAGSELRDWVFSPMFFNAIDWTEIDRFEKPVGELADYICDDRVFGIHLWTARNNPQGRANNALITLLSDPQSGLPRFSSLADRFSTDKNRHVGNRHFYARVYERLLSSRRLSLRHLMEIGLSRWNDTEVPSVALWQSFFPFCRVIGLDLKDFSGLNNERFTSFICDQAKRENLRAVAEKIDPGSLDVVIDDGSHASLDQQQTLREFFPLLADGGWYFIEDLDWQPPGEDTAKITLTKTLLREIQLNGAARSIDLQGVSDLADQMDEILFFDSHYELNRAKLLGGLVAIRKRGGTGFVS